MAGYQDSLIELLIRWYVLKTNVMKRENFILDYNFVLRNCTYFFEI